LILVKAPTSPRTSNSVPIKVTTSLKPSGPIKLMTKPSWVI
jgi:hypothetical protein